MINGMEHIVGQCCTNGVHAAIKAIVGSFIANGRINILQLRMYIRVRQNNHNISRETSGLSNAIFI